MLRTHATDARTLAHSRCCAPSLLRFLLRAVATLLLQYCFPTEQRSKAKMTYETSQWWSCNIHTAHRSLLWSACGCGVEPVLRQKHLGFPLPLKLLLAAMFLLPSEIELIIVSDTTPPPNVQMVKASHIKQGFIGVRFHVQKDIFQIQHSEIESNWNLSS